MKTLTFQDLDGNDQEIEITVLRDRILATCNGSTGIFPLYNKADPMNYKPKRDPAALAAEIYGEAYTGDDKYHRAAKTREITDWLTDGDGGEGRTAAELAAEWIEYDQEPEKDEIE